jgi:hypothetical protein
LLDSFHDIDGDSPIVISGGAISGVPAVGLAVAYIVGHSPQSGGVVESKIEGRLDSSLRYLDLAALVIRNVSPNRVAIKIRAGLKVDFIPVEGKTIKGSYQLIGSNVWDSALSFTADMYKPGSHMCVSFTGPYKHFKLSKGGAILKDSLDAYHWFKRARYSGRRECSYHDDNLDMIGWNFYMMPELATRGLLLMNQFYNIDGTKKHNQDLELPYPDLSKFEVYKK